MKMLNHVTIMGRITRDIELRHTDSGVAVCSFSVAVERDYQPKDGGDREVDFFDVTSWRQQAEFISKYFGKGRMIVVDGRMQSRKWVDNDGKNRVSWEIAPSNVYFGDSKKADSQNTQAEEISTEFVPIEVDDGELPF